MSSSLPLIDQEKCTGCGDCVEACPTHAVEVISNKAAVVRPQDCNYCTACEPVCPEEAIACPFEILLVSGEGKHNFGAKEAR